MEILLSKDLKLIHKSMKIYETKSIYFLITKYFKHITYLNIILLFPDPFKFSKIC